MALPTPAIDVLEAGALLGPPLLSPGPPPLDMDSKDFFRSAMVKEDEREAGFPKEVMLAGDFVLSYISWRELVFLAVLLSSLASMALNSEIDVFFLLLCCSTWCLANGFVAVFPAAALLPLRLAAPSV